MTVTNGREVNGSQDFMRLTNRDIYLKLLELEKAINDLKIKLYAGLGALVVISSFLTLMGGINIGG